MQRPIYLDYAATTPVDPRVASLLGQYLTQEGFFGNPASTTHAFGRAAAHAVETARRHVANLLAAHPDEIIWTSGATEANNLALYGVMCAYRRKGRHLVTCKTEHKAVLDVCRWLEKNGCTVTYLDPQPDGLIDLGQLAAALRPGTVLVSLMHVNNETGVIQDVAALSALTQARKILLHVDAAQSVGKLPINLRTLAIDLLSFSAHKLYGPKGVGALFVRRHPNRVRIDPLLHGGDQERGLRAGTLAVHQIVATGEACRLASLEMAHEQTRLQALRDRLWRGLNSLGAITLNGHPTQHWPGILNVSFSAITAEALVAALPTLAVATGSACTSATTTASHVLRAMGCDPMRARGALRLSFGRFTTIAEIDYAIEAIGVAVNRLRSCSPLWTAANRSEPLTVDWAAPISSS